MDLFVACRWYLLLSFLVMLKILAADDTVGWAAHEPGELGPYPQTAFKSTKEHAPLVHVSQWNETCDQISIVFLCPENDGVGDLENVALALDYKGHLIWHHREQGAISNMQVQEYQGNKYLTYWVGNDRFHGHGHGYYKMLDHTYRLAYVVTAYGDFDGDYHEFSITRENTALITTYVKRPWDLTHLGREHGFVWDCCYQEINIEEDELILSWCASENFRFSDMAVNSWTSWTGTENDPWDWFHMNSVVKDGFGNFLVAARYTNAVTYIDGTSGKILWHLGGLQSSYVDVSEGNATRFVDPHMAQWNDENSTIVLFDNIDYWTIDKPQKQSRGVMVQLNHERGNAKVMATFESRPLIFATSEGSIQHLSNGNYFIGYGSAPAYSEFSFSGELLCSTSFSPGRLYSSEGVLVESQGWSTYRLYKHHWIGKPTWQPEVKFEDTFLYISWNGATEVYSWNLEELDEFSIRGHTSSRRPVRHAQRTGFETAIMIHNTTGLSYRLTALDRSGHAINSWRATLDGVVEEFDSSRNAGGGLQISLQIAILALLVLCIGILAHFNRKMTRDWRWIGFSKIYMSIPSDVPSTK